MDINEFNNRMREEVKVFQQTYRDERAAFLSWFLKNYFNLDEQLAVDSVCDGGNDKGIDGIWIDEESEEIYIFQSCFSPNDGSDHGDAKIRNFYGTKSWFSSEENVNSLLDSIAKTELKELILSQEISDKVANEYKIILVYVTNKIWDTNANEYLDTLTDFEPYDNNALFDHYTYFSESEVDNSPKTLDIPNTSVIEYNSCEDIETIVLSIPAKEIIKLDGIRDHTLFSRNVRYWAGNTRVNKDIQKTLLNNLEHEKLFLYHNGITIICTNFNFNVEDKQLELGGYQVINGCQSIISFFENQSSLTDDATILVKIIKIEMTHPLIQKITHNANNQNSISLKDLKSNDRIQRGLQKKFNEYFNNKVLYKIKKGEDTENYDEIIDLDFAAQCIVAFYLKEPHSTHLKSKMFSDMYNTIFSRKMTCQKIYFAYYLYKLIDANKDELSNDQVKTYGLAKFAILRYFRDLLENDELGKKIIENPDKYLEEGERDKLKQSIEKVFKLVALDINDFIEEYIKQEDGFFDYKNLFKNKDFIEKMNTSILSAHKKSLIRHPEDSFLDIYNTFENE